MDLPPQERRWPSVPDDLKYTDLRLPGTFRELCADSRFTHEQLGRIIRCIALDSDVFATPQIEPEIFFYRRNLRKRFQAKMRQLRFRKKHLLMGVEDPDAVEVESPPPPSTFVSLSDAEKVFALKNAERVDEAPSRVPDPVPNPVPKTEPSHCPKVAPARRTKKEMARDALSEDLFTLVGAKEGSVADRRRANAHISDSANPDVDRRNDAAWIPGKFAMFWKEYPRKVAKSDALRAFTKLIKAQNDVSKFMDKVLASLAYWKTQDQWTKDKGKFIPYPATWLNAGHWSDCDETRCVPAQATFLGGDAESDEDLLRRMKGE